MAHDSLLTKCPYCLTLFRIQQEHLAAAGGDVRCGICYKVFNARVEGTGYSVSKASPAGKADDQQINTSSEPEQDPLKISLDADLDSLTETGVPSQSDLDQINIGNTNITDQLNPTTKINRRHMLKWASLSLLAIFALFAQRLIFNFATNAYQPQWHSLYATVCQKLGCELPAYQQVSAITTDRLAIKTHPKYSNVLIVDMIISNTAQHSQPLPILNMTFSNMTGKTLAQRLFQPVEYLGDQFKLLPLMPPKTPIHLSFAILDPGGKAVNYSVIFEPSF